jgi:hypothetical protein
MIFPHYHHHLHHVKNKRHHSWLMGSPSVSWSGHDSGEGSGVVLEYSVLPVAFVLFVVVGTCNLFNSSQLYIHTIFESKI